MENELERLDKKNLSELKLFLIILVTIGLVFTLITMLIFYRKRIACCKCLKRTNGYSNGDNENKDNKQREDDIVTPSSAIEINEISLRIKVDKHE